MAINRLLYLALLVLVLALSIFDRQRMRVPNTVVILLILAGFLGNFPGTILHWAGASLLFAGWQRAWIGGGDAKLWIALMWLAPVDSAATTIFWAGVIFACTSLLQIVWRYVKNQPVMGVRSPAVWRTIPMVLWMLWST